MGSLYSEQELLILDRDGEDLVMGVIWFNSVMTAKRSEITKIVDIRGFGIPEQVPIEFSQDVAPEDDLLENLDLDAFPSQISEPWEMCTFNPYFPELDRLQAIVKYHGSVLFQPFDKKGLRISPLKLKVHPFASFLMQPCRFIRDGILKLLKTMLDQFVSKGVFISDILRFCESTGHYQQERWWLIA